MGNVDQYPQLLLASMSPRRRELLSLLGIEFAVRVADVDETRHPGETPGPFALRLAREKVDAVKRCIPDGVVVIGADTIVVNGSDILGKPQDPADADRILRALRGRSHEVLTAITVDPVGESVTYDDACTTEVQVRAFTDKEIDLYVASGDPLDKAGAYGIQNRQFRPAEPVDGCLANVMGLPLCHLTRNLRLLNIHSPVDVPHACQMHIEYDCPVYEQILAP